MSHVAEIYWSKKWASDNPIGHTQYNVPYLEKEPSGTSSYEESESSESDDEAHTVKVIREKKKKQYRVLAIRRSLVREPVQKRALHCGLDPFAVDDLLNPVPSETKE